MAFSNFYGINKVLFSAFKTILNIFEKKSVCRKKNAKAIVRAFYGIYHRSGN